MELMDDEVYLLRREVAGLRAENARLRARLCDPHDPVMDSNFVWRCAKCDAWINEGEAPG